MSGLAQLGVSEFPAVDTLATLDISYCRALTDTGLAHLHKSVAAVQTHSTFIDTIEISILYYPRVRNLTRLDAGHTQISSEGLAKLVAKSEHKLKLYGKVGAWL